jgi:hypothetical protein
MTADTTIPPKAVKYGSSMPAPVHRALSLEAAEKGMDTNELINFVLTRHAMASGRMADEEGEQIDRLWKLVDQAVAAAVAIVERREFDRTITLRAIKECMADPEWVKLYRAYVKDDIYKNGIPLKGVVNRELGFRIRQAIGGVVETKDGKPVIERVLGEIIQTYTPMADYDRKKFGH